MARGPGILPGSKYHHQMMRSVVQGGSEGYEWLRDRALKNSTITQWHLGEVVEPAVPEHERFVGCATFPYYDIWGRELGVRFRYLDGRKKGKYDQTTGWTHLFAVRYASADRVYITEGEIDCMTIHQLGLKAVGVPGANTWKDHWRWAFRECSEIIIVPDADGTLGSKDEPASGGALFKMKVMLSLKGLPAHVWPARLPEGYDVNDLYREDRDELRRRLKGG